MAVDTKKKVVKEVKNITDKDVAYEYIDPEIDFISIVDAGANWKEFEFMAKEGRQGLLFQLRAKDTKQHIVAGVVAEPFVKNTQGGYFSDVTIEKMAHEFMRKQKIAKIDIQHDYKTVDAYVCESYILAEDNKYGLKGSWFVKIKINDVDVWQKIEKGELKAFSPTFWSERQYKIVKGENMKDEEKKVDAKQEELAQVVKEKDLLIEQLQNKVTVQETVTKELSDSLKTIQQEFIELKIAKTIDDDIMKNNINKSLVTQKLKEQLMIAYKADISEKKEFYHSILEDKLLILSTIGSKLDAKTEADLTTDSEEKDITAIEKLAKEKNISFSDALIEYETNKGETK